MYGVEEVGCWSYGVEEEGGGRGGSSGSDCPAYPHTGPQCLSSHRGPVQSTAYPHRGARSTVVL